MTERDPRIQIGEPWVGADGFTDQAWAGAFSPTLTIWSDHAIGRSIRRLTPKPRGSRPSIAALARVGERKASDNVMRIERSVLRSRRCDALRWFDWNRRQFVEPTMGIAERVDENPARFNSHRPHRGRSIAFALNDLAASMGRWRRPGNRQDPIRSSSAVPSLSSISIAVRPTLTRSMAARSPRRLELPEA